MNRSSSRKKEIMQRGFTLVEVLLSIFITVLISGTMAVSYRNGAATNDLKRTAARVALDVRRAQNAAINTTRFGAEAPYGYGLYYSMNSPTQVLLFADLNDNNTYIPFVEDAEIVETIELDNGVSLSALSPSSPLVVFFRAPDPKTFINAVPSGIADITVRLDNDQTQTRTIRVNVSGEISIN